MTVYDLHMLKDYVEECTLCELNKDRINLVMDKGNPGANIFICGMAPAKEENETGVPFVGRAGKLLDTILEEAGLSLKTVYITNLVKCFLPAGEKLKEEWVAACFPYLLSQIATISPKVVLTLGADASEALIGNKFNTISRDRGSVLTLNGGLNIVPTYHPSYILRKGGIKSLDYPKVLMDFIKAKDISREK